MVYMGTAVSVAALPTNRYVPRGRNELHTIFERHFADFCEHYDENFAANLRDVSLGADPEAR
jgi:hypothetical protein